MTTFNKTIDREITFPSSTKGVKAITWIVSIGPNGIGFRQKGNKDSKVSASWREILGFLLIHGHKNNKV